MNVIVLVLGIIALPEEGIILRKRAEEIMELIKKTEDATGNNTLCFRPLSPGIKARRTGHSIYLRRFYVNPR